MKKRSLEKRKPCVGEEEEGFNKVYIFSFRTLFH